MLKKFVISFICFILVGCSSKSININASDFTKKIVDELNLNDILIKIDENDIENILYLDENILDEASLYMSNSNKADIIGILKSNNINKVEENIKEYIEVIAISNGNYFPEEFEKLNDAFIEVKGNYLFIVVSDKKEEIKKIINTIK